MTTITNPARDDHFTAALIRVHFTAALIRAHLRLLIVGTRHSQLSGTAVLKAATRFTGTKYKRGQYQTALDDIQAFINKINAELAEA
jgi:hypothetical protein